MCLQVLYPDGQSHVIHPKPGDFRKAGPGRHRLITQVYLSHFAWTGENHLPLHLHHHHRHHLLLLLHLHLRLNRSLCLPEPSQIEVRLLLAYSCSSTSTSSKSCWSDVLDALPAAAEAPVEGSIPLSKPVRVYIMPKPARR